jgi:hypothetical protein
VYDKALANEDRSFINRIKRALSVGRVSGLFYLCLLLIECLVLLALVVFQPKSKMKKEINVDYEAYLKILKKL